MRNDILGYSKTFMIYCSRRLLLIMEVVLGIKCAICNSYGIVTANISAFALKHKARNTSLTVNYESIFMTY